MTEPMRVMPRVLVCKGEDIERAEALLRATCEGDAAHETPIKTGSAMGEAGRAGQEVP